MRVLCQIGTMLFDSVKEEFHHLSFGDFLSFLA